MNGWRSIAGFLALRRNTVLLLAALVLAGTGEKPWLGFAPKYPHTLGAKHPRHCSVWRPADTAWCHLRLQVTLLRVKNCGWLTPACVVRGLPEFGEPARKALIIGEAVPELRARTYGANYLIRDCMVTSGFFPGAWPGSLSPELLT